MGIDSWAYKVVFLVHILSAILGFGGPLLNGVYAAQAQKRRGAEAAAIVEANLHVTVKWNQKFIYLVALSGIGLIALSDNLWSPGDLWIVLAVVLYVAGIGISHGALTPGAKRQAELVRAAAGHTGDGPPPQLAEMQANGKQLAAMSSALDLILLVILVLMIWKPGA